MNSLGYEYQSDFARLYVAEGRAEGWVAGRMDFVLKMLARRFGPLSNKVETRIRCAQDAQLCAVAERMLTAQTLEEGLEAAEDSLRHELENDFARRYFVQGKSEGLIEGRTSGRRKLMRKLLVARFGPLPSWATIRIRTEKDEGLDEIADRILTAKTLEEALESLE